MASSKAVKDLFRWQTLKEPKIVQFDRVLYKWFTAMHSEGKPVPGPMIIEKSKACLCEMKVSDECTFCDSSNKNYV
jgi:hypothetical protein